MIRNFVNLFWPFIFILIVLACMTVFNNLPISTTLSQMF